MKRPPLLCQFMTHPKPTCGSPALFIVHDEVRGRLLAACATHRDDYVNLGYRRVARVDLPKADKR